jgi:hypothetical protein
MEMSRPLVSIWRSDIRPTRSKPGCCQSRRSRLIATVAGAATRLRAEPCLGWDGRGGGSDVPAGSGYGPSCWGISAGSAPRHQLRGHGGDLARRASSSWLAAFPGPGQPRSCLDLGRVWLATSTDRERLARGATGDGVPEAQLVGSSVELLAIKGYEEAWLLEVLERTGLANVGSTSTSAPTRTSPTRSSRSFGRTSGLLERASCRTRAWGAAACPLDDLHPAGSRRRGMLPAPAGGRAGPSPLALASTAHQVAWAPVRDVAWLLRSSTRTRSA